jgi:hypothetical protein
MFCSECCIPKHILDRWPGRRERTETLSSSLDLFTQNELPSFNYTRKEHCANKSLGVCLSYACLGDRHRQCRVSKKIQSGSQQCSDSNSVAFSQFSLSYQETDLTNGTASMGYHEITRQMRFKDNTKKEKYCDKN